MTECEKKIQKDFLGKNNLSFFINRFTLAVENSEKIVAFWYFLTRTFLFFELFKKKIFSIHSFLRIFNIFGNFNIFPLFFLVLGKLNFNYKQNKTKYYQVPLLFLYIFLLLTFKKDWNLETIQLLFFNWSGILDLGRSTNILPGNFFFNLFGQWGNIFFYNIPNTDLKLFQQQVLLIDNVVKNYPNFFDLKSNSNFFKQICYKFFKNAYCYKVGDYFLRILNKILTQFQITIKSSFYFRSSFLNSSDFIKKGKKQEVPKSNYHFLERTIWVNRCNTTLLVNKTVKIKRKNKKIYRKHSSIQ